MLCKGCRDNNWAYIIEDTLIINLYQCMTCKRVVATGRSFKELQTHRNNDEVI